MDEGIRVTREGAKRRAAPRTKAGEANEERILDAALDAFAASGFHGARIDAIAATAGLSKPNLLYYFKTKEALYLAVLRRTLDMWLEPLRELDEARDPRTALAAYVVRKLDYSRDMPAASKLFALEILRGAPLLGRVLDGPLKALVDEKVAILERWIAAGRLAPVDPHTLIFAIWATTQHYADFSSQVAAVTGRTLADETFFAETREGLVRLLLDGAVPRAR
ncbi:HTH-type transcriptional regulator RutR [Salinarimonas ramus]|uniref:TetR family transcriptional regulator n=1 Tax=Salinarimonas ramus TaxID=690164 RepID=A0A917Q4Z1_9HYPH|nr:HTH-type transcriptional regulator RutR [Salinarimonas ramus]GGK23105.1 TetR family transcriptional regulator [Salinarimonas ramus]